MYVNSLSTLMGDLGGQRAPGGPVIFIVNMKYA